MNEPIEHTVSSGNIFLDLRLPDAEGALVKADLARAISRIIREHGMTQASAAELMGVDQPKVSAITRGRLGGFSVERLMACLRALRQDVIITVRPSVEEEGRILVAAGEA